MASVEERLNKLREERIAREKARIEKLRDLNLKKYNKNEPPASKSFPSSASVSNPIKTEIKKTSSLKNVRHVKNNLSVNGTTKRPITAPTANEKKHDPDRINQLSRPKTITTHIRNDTKMGQKINKPLLTKVEAPKTNKIAANIANIAKICNNHEKSVASKSSNAYNTTKPVKGNSKIDSKVTNGQGNNKQYSNITLRKSMMPPKMTIAEPPKTEPRRSISHNRKSLLPVIQSTSKVNPNRQSVYERLYQPKTTQQQPKISDADKLKTDPNYLKKLVRNSGLILNKRHTFQLEKFKAPVRRSISAVHFKRISSAELKNCIHKWSSIGEKLDRVNLKEIREDASVKDDKIVSAIKSERKKNKFASTFSLNTPRPEELQMRLQNWLQKRGKSLDSYHHLQCFGIHHLAQQHLKQLDLEQEKFDPEVIEEDEDKENVPLESDSDNESFTDIMNEQGQSNDLPNNKKIFNDNNWRCANVSDSVDFNDTRDTTLTPSEAVHHVDDLLLGALNDLTELLREGFDWEHCARWLRAIRQRFPSAPDHAAYWECRAAVEERRGDLASSVECWEEAIAKGTERSVVEANLDQLLDKFMQLKISPNTGGARRQPDSKMLDIKNVFKSTLIRFAVQQAKLRQSQEPAKYTVTPVRRSARLSAHWSCKTKTPLQLCSSVKQAGMLGHSLQFVPNHTLADTP